MDDFFFRMITTLSNFFVKQNMESKNEQIAI